MSFRPVSSRQKPCRETGVALGHQLSIEYYDCRSSVLADTALMEEIFLRAAERANATIISSHFHAFSPQGVSGVVIISESHFAVHAWPEFDYAAVDIFTCGDTIDFNAATESLREDLGSARMIISGAMNRGLIGNQGVEHLVTVCEEDTDCFSLSWRSRFDRMQAKGISVAVDLYGCDAAALLDPASDAAWSRALAELLGVEPVTAPERIPMADGLISIRQNFPSCLLTGVLDPAHGAAYFDLFRMKFMEPREAAEITLKVYRAKRYRMQIAVRE